MSEKTLRDGSTVSTSELDAMRGHVYEAIIGSTDPDFVELVALIDERRYRQRQQRLKRHGHCKRFDRGCM